MKIIESKFYSPIQVFEEKYLAGSQTFTTKDFLDEAKNSHEPYEILLNRLLPSVYLGSAEMVILKEHLQDFVKCTDFHTISFHHHKETFYTAESCYFHPKYEFFMLTNDDLSDEYSEFIVEKGMSRVMRIFYDSTNPDSPKNMEDFYSHYLQKYKSNEAKISILMKENNEFVFKSHKVHPYTINLDTMYNDNFLPVHQKIKKDLAETHKGLVLLHGMAGSGKTNYIKWLTQQLPDKNFIFVPNNMIQLLTEPSFINLLIEKKNSVIVLEDCENYIAERNTNSQTDVVASILNVADGILSDILECQFICTFNAKLTEVDHALLRKGRLIAEYYFDELHVEKCNAYLKSIDKTVIVDKKMTLAELANLDEEAFLAEKNKQSIGFLG